VSSDSKSDVANGVKPQITRITQIHEGKTAWRRGANHHEARFEKSASLARSAAADSALSIFVELT
jgi:hypothetical protein